MMGTILQSIFLSRDLSLAPVASSPLLPAFWMYASAESMPACLDWLTVVGEGELLLDASPTTTECVSFSIGNSEKNVVIFFLQ